MTELARPPRGRRTRRRRGLPRHRGGSVADRPARGPAAGRPGHCRGNRPSAGRDRRALSRRGRWPPARGHRRRRRRGRLDVAQAIGHVATARVGAGPGGVAGRAGSLAGRRAGRRARRPGIRLTPTSRAAPRQDRPEPADRRARRRADGRPRDRRLPARPPARRPPAVRRVAAVRRRPRPHAPRSQLERLARRSRHRPV